MPIEHSLRLPEEIPAASTLESQTQTASQMPNEKLISFRPICFGPFSSAISLGRPQRAFVPTKRFSSFFETSSRGSRRKMVKAITSRFWAAPSSQVCYGR